MPTGIYKRTKKHKKRISRSLKQSYKNREAWHKGQSKEINKSLLKMSLSLRGKIPWNKGRGVNKLCQTCNKEFYVINSRIKDKGGKFCSMKCKEKYPLKKSKKYKLTTDMAELIGIIIGDGCIHKPKNRKDEYVISISSNPIEDKYFMEKYIPRLLYKCINEKKKPFIAKNGAYVIRIHNKSFALFLKGLGIKERKSKNVGIPEEIKKDKKLLTKCIRGIADTDFTLIFTKKHTDRNFYPRITGQFASQRLVKDIEDSLRKMDFTLNTLYNYKQKDYKRRKIWKTSRINLEGPHNLKRWLKLIGFSNIRIISRYKLWKQKGFLQPKTTLPEGIKELGWVGGDLYGQKYTNF